MDDSGKRKIYEAIQKSLSSISNEKIRIVSYSPYYAVNGTSGIKFLVKIGGNELPFFAGFSSDKKYSEKLLFGILKSESNEKIGKLNLDKDENGNNIQGKFSIDEKFLSADEDTQKSKLTKWLSEQITTVFILYKMWNKSPRKNKETQRLKKTEGSDSINWFKTVELPWIVTLLGIVPTCFCPIFAETNETIFMALAASGSLIFLAGVIAIIATIGKKREIRNERNLLLTKNPYTWFVSYIGKVVCGTTILCLGIGVFILIALFAAGVSSSSSVSVSSSNSSSTGKRTSWSNKVSKLYWYTCSNCGLAIKNNQSPSRNGCSNSTFHYWHNVGEVGDNNYCCKHCGVTIQTKQSPFRIGCPNSSFHNWYKL